MLVALWDVSNQFNDNNGSILTNGKVYVYYSGRAALAPTWSSADGSHVNSNPIILDNNGRAVAFADDQYTYTCVVCDFYGRELFSFDPASFGTGGGGSTTEGNDAAHWIGATGTDVQVTALADTLLPLPSNPDYEGDFVSQTTYTTISLNKGLYMVDADIRIQQDDDLENIIKDISVYTGLTGPDSLITSQKNWTGPEASDDRHYIHVHFIRHVADEGEDIYFQMNSPVDLSSAWIDKLSIVKLTEGGNGKNYVGGYGIDITGPVISVSGMIPEASAANFVDVSTYNTDIENIYETIADTSAMIPSGVATEQYVQDFTSAFITEDALDGYATQDWVVGQGYITSADLPDLSDYATQQWVEDQNYITSADIPPIPQDVVTSGELATVSGDIISQIPSLDGYATQQWVEDQNYITSADIPPIPEDVVTSGELASTSAELESMIPSVDGYATEQFVEDYTSAFITSADVPHFTQEQADWNEDDQSAPDYIKNKPTIPSLDGYATEQYVQDYTSAFITSADIPDVPADVVTSGQLATVSGDIVNQIPDVSDMATQTWVNEQGFLTSIPDDLVTSGELATVSGQIMNEIPDTSDMATKTWVGQQGYLTSIPAEYATSGDLVTLSGAIEADIPSYTAGDNISIVNDEISVSGTTGLIAGENISITASGDNYVISSTGGEVPADVVTSGELATVSGEIMSQMPSQTTVSIDPTLSSGTKIAEFNINGTSGELYAPNGGGASYTAGAGIAIDGNGAISVVPDNTTVKVYRPMEVYATKDSFYGTMSFSDEQLGSATSNSTCTFNYGLNTGDDPFKISCSSDQIGCEIRVEMGNDQYFTKSVIGTVSMAKSNQTGVLVTLTDTETILDGYGLTFYRAWGSPTYRFSNSFDWTDYTFDEIFENSAIYVRLRAWDSTNGVVVGSPLGNPTSIGTPSYVSANMSLNSDGVPQQIGVVNPLPDYSYEDAGKVLQVQNDGLIAWSQAGGSEVDIIPSLSSGTKIADYVIGGTSGELYAPNGGGDITYPLVYYTSGELEEEPIMTSAVYVYQEDDKIIKNISTTSPFEIVVSEEKPWLNSIQRTTIDHNGIHLEYEDLDEQIDASWARHLKDNYWAVTESAAYWNSAYNAINDSASNWNDAAGMNEYPISAGPGMSIEDVSGVTVFGPDVPYLTQAVGADETVIYNGKLPNLNGNLTLSESWNNFKQIRVRGGDNTPEDHYYSSVSPSKAAFKISWAYNWMNEAYLKFSSTNDPKVWTYAANTYVHYTHADTAVYVTQNDTTTLGSGCNFKIVGIGRISGGN